ncbi:MAG: hypothetical protein JWQ42_3862 [Edaphobacter sp.]|nr:hypothetical protein [Edaphobacter sp.]
MSAMYLISAVSLMDGALPTDASPIIKAVTDPFSLLALIVLILGLIATKWIPRKQDGKVWPHVVALSILVISLLAIALNVMRYINTAKTGTTAMADQGKHPLSITINITSNKRTLKPTIVPFEVGGGEVSFGCGESAHPAVTYTLPKGARDVAAHAEWRDTDHAKGQTQSAAIAGQMVIASGTITGQDRNWVGKCMGAGHGELVLKGTYTVDQEGEPVQVVNTVTGFITAGKEQSFTIPGVAGSSATHCEIVVSSVDGEIASATVPLNAMAAVEKPKFNGPIQATWSKGKLMVSVE